MAESAWCGACRGAGLVGVRPHDLCRTFASWLVMAGTPLRTVAALLGHGSQSMVMRYSHLSDDRCRDRNAILPPLFKVRTV